MLSAAKNASTYRVRESRRAKHVSIKISFLGEVEVVVPLGYDQDRIPRLVQERRDWITKTVQQLQAEWQTVASTQDWLPHHIHLRARSQQWQVRYYDEPKSRIRLVSPAAHRLELSGPIQDQAHCQKALQGWLRQQAIAHLTPWLRQVSQEFALPCNRISVRGQKTRWASCSSQQNISLNYKLLFLPPELVRYVFIHELCHILQMDHSPAFWALVQEREPNYAQLDTDLRRAWRYVPVWAEHLLTPAKP